jgi:hypothetical protein
MLVYQRFEDDNDNILMELQYEMYHYSICTIFNEIKRIYLENPYAILYLSKLEIERLRKIDGFDHRLIQDAHDVFAAIFRFQKKEGFYEKELFEEDNDQIKHIFNTAFVDIDFLEKIPDKYWYLALKWHYFLYEILRENIPFTRDLALATLIYYDSFDDRKMAWDAASRAAKLIKEKYDEIPWLEYKDKHKTLTNYTLTKESIYKGLKLTIVNFSDNILSITYTADYYDSDGFWEEYFTINRNVITKIILRIRNVYKPIDIELLDEDARSYYGSILDEDSRLLFLYIQSIKISKPDDILHGDELVNILCGPEISYERKVYSKGP